MSNANQGSHFPPLRVWGRGSESAPYELPFTGNRGQTSVTTSSGTDGAGGGSGAYHYVEIPCEDVSIVSLQWDWFDGSIDVNGTAVIQFTNHPYNEPNGIEVVAPASDGANDWVTDSTLTVTGPAGSAAGSEITTFSAVGYRRARLRYQVNVGGSNAFRVWGKS